MTESQTTTIVITIVSALVMAAIISFFQKRGKKSEKLKLLEDDTKYYKVKLIKKDDISWNVRNFRFALPSPDHALGLPTGQHISINAKIDNQTVMRSYTPVTSDDEKGYFDLVVKIYFRNQHKDYPAGGKMSQYLDELSIGDEIEIKGPRGKLTYEGRGRFVIKKNQIDRKFKRVGMIAGGTGITPMLSIMRAVIKDASDETQLHLLFANQTEDDILIRQELEEAQAARPNQIHVWYTLDRGNDNWKYDTGFVNADMISKHLPPPGDDTLILTCGPPPMMKFACEPNLDKLGYNPTLRFAY